MNTGLASSIAKLFKTPDMHSNRVPSIVISALGRQTNICIPYPRALFMPLMPFGTANHAKPELTDLGITDTNNDPPSKTATPSTSSSGPFLNGWKIDAVTEAEASVRADQSGDRPVEILQHETVVLVQSVDPDDLPRDSVGEREKLSNPVQNPYK